MQILILGGTRFLGRALVEAISERGHELTLFNRGKTNPDLFPFIEKLVGDRDGYLDALTARQWDAVIDTSGYVPRVVGQSLEMLKNDVNFYVFISSVSAYADLSQPIDESSTLATMLDASVEEITENTYGPLKVMCEDAVEKAFPGSALIVRPGYIVGPHDPSDRFTWWPYRVAQGGEMLCPGDPGNVIQVIDVRDLADWIIRMVEEQVNGIYNAVGPQISMADLLSVCQTVSGSEAIFMWVSEEFIRENIANLWTSFPIWVPQSLPEYAGMHAVDAGKALANGLTCRSIEHTVRAILQWCRSRPVDYVWQTGLRFGEEKDLLKKWRQFSSRHSQQG